MSCPKRYSSVLTALSAELAVPTGAAIRAYRCQVCGGEHVEVIEPAKRGWNVGGWRWETKEKGDDAIAGE